MISLSQIEADLTAAIKAKDKVAMDTLRGLKTRIQNEKTAAGRPKPASPAGGRSEGSLAPAGSGKELSEEEITALVRSEVKRRKEAAESFAAGGRAESADKELKEAGILEKYLPPQLSEQEISGILDKLIAENNWTAKDFGKAMGLSKQQLGVNAEAATTALLLKEKLK